MRLRAAAKMRRPISIIIATLLAAVVTAGAGVSLPATAGLLAQQANHNNTDRPLTKEELHTLARRGIANQHRNDAALNEYERRERRIERDTREDLPVVEDKTFRVVPTGTGTLKLVIEEKGKRVYPNFYEKQLHDLEQVLVDATEHQNTYSQRRAIEKWQKRTQERYDLVEGVEDAFLVTWLGRERRNGRLVVRLQLNPNPEFKPKTRIAGALQSVRAVVWLDEKEAQLVRAEADIFRDISVGGGLLGKVYRGGKVIIEQAEVAPGIWFPTLYRIDFEGRKFVFGFDVHQTIDIRDFRRIGPPAEALASIRREIASNRNGKPSS